MMQNKCLLIAIIHNFYFSLLNNKTNQYAQNERSICDHSSNQFQLNR